MEEDRKLPGKGDDNNDDRKRKSRKVPQKAGTRRGRKKNAPKGEPKMRSIKSSLSMDSISEDEALPDVRVRDRSRESSRWASSGTSSGTDSDSETNVRNVARAASMKSDGTPRAPRRKAFRTSIDPSARAAGPVAPETRMAQASQEDMDISQRSTQSQANSAGVPKKPQRRGSGNNADAASAMDTAVASGAQAVQPSQEDTNIEQSSARSQANSAQALRKPQRRMSGDNTVASSATGTATVTGASALESFSAPQNQAQRRQSPRRRSSLPPSNTAANQEAKKASKSKPKRKSF